MWFEKVQCIKDKISCDSATSKTEGLETSKTTTGNLHMTQCETTKPGERRPNLLFKPTEIDRTYGY